MHLIFSTPGFDNHCLIQLVNTELVSEPSKRIENRNIEMKILVSRSYRDIDRYNGSYRAAPPSGPASRGWPSSGYSSGYATPSGRPVSPDARGSAAWNERERDRYDRDRVYDRDSTFYRRSSREDYREAPRTQPSSYDKDAEENHEGRFRQSDWTGSRSFPRDNWRRSPSTNRSASPRSSRRSSPPSIRVPSPLPARDWRESEDQQRQSSRHDDAASGAWTNASRLPPSSPASHIQGTTPGSRSSLSAAPPRRRDTQVSSSTLEDHASPRDAFRKEARTDHHGSIDAKVS